MSDQLTLLSADDSIQLECKGGADLKAVPFIIELCFVNAQLGHAACSCGASSPTAPGLPSTEAGLDLDCLTVMVVASDKGHS